MKKIYCFFILQFLFWNVCMAHVITVSNQFMSPGQYFTIQAAINAANPDDTIYVHASPYTYGNIVVNKRLTFIGPGFNPQGQFTLSSLIGSITLDSLYPSSSAAGSRFIGLNIAYVAKKTIDFVQINDILFDRCRFYSNTTNYISGNTYTFRNCLFHWSGFSSYIDCGYYSNLLFTNNVFSFATSSGSSTAVLKNSDKASVIINNNLFTGYHSGNSFSSVSNAYISNNIFFGKSPLDANTSVFECNLTWCSNPTLPYGSNTGQNNIVFQDPMFINVPQNIYLFSFLYDFDLQAGSPAKNAGCDGTDIGIFGGPYPIFRNNNFITGEPSLPQVYYLNIQNNIIALTTPLDVSLKTRRIDGAPIYTGEYFFDNDPGVGNGIPLTQLPPTNDTTLSFQILASGLQPGQHYIYFRFKNTLDKWGLHARMEFTSCDVLAQANFTADTVCLGQDSTSFINLSTGGDANTIYRWDMDGDGIDDFTHIGIIGMGAPLQFKYFFQNGGSHNVQLITENGGGCTDTLIKQVYVKAFPPVPVPIGTDSLCVNSPNTLYTIPQVPEATAYYWVLSPPTAGAISVLSGDTAIEVNWDNAFTGNVQIIAGAIYNTCDSTSSAPHSPPLNINISEQSIGGTISLIDSTICLGNSTGIMTLSGQTGAVLWWEKSCNGSAWTPIPASASLTYSEIPNLSGVCQYRVLIKNGVCNSAYSAIATITINTVPDTAGTIIGPSGICTGDEVIFSVPPIAGADVYTWAVPMGATIISGFGTDSILVHFNISANSGGVYVFASNACGHGAQSIMGVTVNPSPFVFVTPHPDTTITCNTSVAFYGAVIGGTFPITIQWSPASLVTSPNSISTSTTTLTDTTVFTLTVTDTLGCSSTVQTTVNVFCLPLLVVATSDSSTICAGDSSVLTAHCTGGSQPYTFEWASNPGTFYSALQNPVVYPVVNTTYTVTVTGGGQTVTAQTVVNVMPLPGPAGMISAPPVMYYGQTGVNLSVQPISNATAYIWTLPQGFTLVSGQNTNAIIVDIALTASPVYISVYGTNSCGYGISSTYFPATIITGIAGFEDASFSVYPTLSSGAVFVRMNVNTQEKITVRLFNQYGALVFEEVKGQELLQSFDFSCFSNGLYYMQISGNGFSKTVKIGIQR